MGHWNAENARRLRRRNGLTQEEVADAVGVERKAVIAWESESGREPKLRQAVALADLFQVPLDDLIHEPDADTALDGRGKGPDNTPAPAPDPTAVTVDGIRAGAAHGG